MWQKVMACVLCLSLVMVSSSALAQGAKRSKGSEVSQRGPRRQITTIVMAGLAGAILGLSTLSFYGRPQDYLSNIAVGFAAGVITGTVYTTFQAATNPQDFYNQKDFLDQRNFAALDGLTRRVPPELNPPSFTMTWRF